MRVIFNADDFGASTRVNSAVAEAHRLGVLTSASLMPAEPSAAEAVTLARESPRLDVGLHVALSDALAAGRGADVSRLAGRDGRFPRHPAVAGMRMFFDPGSRRQAAREVAHQFELFDHTGLALHHVDGHQHLHLHPVVWAATVSEATKRGVGWIRIPHEEWIQGSSATAALERAFFSVLRRRCLKSAKCRSLSVADRVYGHLRTGRMTGDIVRSIVARLDAPVNEIYLHPGAGNGSDLELQALVSPEVRSAVEHVGAELTTYRDLTNRPGVT